MTDPEIEHKRLTSGDAVLPPGTYRPRPLLGGPAAALEIGSSGRMQGYAPLETIEPLESHVVQIY